MRFDPRLRTAGLGLAAALFWTMPLPAHAQVQPDTAAVKARAYRHVAAACQAEYLKLCPDSVQSDPQPRREIICLKDYRADLSLGCRGAIDAARKSAPAP